MTVEDWYNLLRKIKITINKKCKLIKKFHNKYKNVIKNPEQQFILKDFFMDLLEIVFENNFYFQEIKKIIHNTNFESISDILNCLS